LELLKINSVVVWKLDVVGIFVNDELAQLVVINWQSLLILPKHLRACHQLPLIAQTTINYFKCNSIANFVAPASDGCAYAGDC
jgi:hypothetical protein